MELFRVVLVRKGTLRLLQLLKIVRLLPVRYRHLFALYLQLVIASLLLLLLKKALRESAVCFVRFFSLIVFFEWIDELKGNDLA